MATDNLKTRYKYPIGPEFSKIFLDPEMEFLGQLSPILIIGLTGRTKVGKTQIAKHLVTNHEFSYISLSKYLQKFAASLGKPSNSKDLLDVAKILRSIHGYDFLAQMAIEDIRHIYRMNNRIVIDGILHPDEIKYFKMQFRNFFSLYIDAIDAIRVSQALQWKAIKEEREISERDVWEQVSENLNDPLLPNILSCKTATDEEIIIEDFSRDHIFDKVDKIIDKYIKLCI